MSEIENLLQCHEAFWDRGEASEPLVRLMPPRWEPYRYDDMDVTPDKVDVERLTPDVGTRNIHKQLVQGSLLRTAVPFSRIPWMEALIGCGIHSGTGNAMWPVPALGPNYEGMENIVPADDNPWLLKLVALAEALEAANDGSYIVTHTLMRGPSDMLSALLGDERMGLALYDAPDTINEILSRCAEAFIKVADAQFAVTPGFRGGRMAWGYGLWGKGRVIRFQSDSSSQLSPRMYARVILPHDRTIMKAFDRSIIDLHSAGTLHLHKVLMDTDELDAISVTLDRYENAPTVQELLPTFATILEKKALLVTGECTQAEADLMVRELPAAGLAINGHLTDKLLWEREI